MNNIATEFGDRTAPFFMVPAVFSKPNSSPFQELLEQFRRTDAGLNRSFAVCNMTYLLTYSNSSLRHWHKFHLLGWSFSRGRNVCDSLGAVPRLLRSFSWWQTNKQTDKQIYSPVA